MSKILSSHDEDEYEIVEGESVTKTASLNESLENSKKKKRRTKACSNSDPAAEGHTCRVLKDVLFSVCSCLAVAACILSIRSKCFCNICFVISLYFSFSLMNEIIMIRGVFKDFYKFPKYELRFLFFPTTICMKWGLLRIH